MMAKAQTQTAGGSASQPGSGATGTPNPIIAALHEMAVSVLSEQLREMFEKADDILFDSAEKARASDEQRLYLDTMRIVRVQRNKIIQAFQESLRSALAGLDSADDAEETARLDDISQWSLQDGDALEERIAVSNMQTKAASLHAHELVELQRRLARLADLSGGGLSPDSMSPARIIRAFQNSMRDLSVDFPIKLVIYKLFDRVVVGRLSEVFVGANQLLAVHGIEPQADALPRPRPLPPRQARSLPPEAGVPAWAAGFDSTMINRFAALPGGVAADTSYGSLGVPGGNWAAAPAFAPATSTGAYTDGILAQEVTHILSAYAQGRRPQAPAWLPPENVALVARMFDGYYRDPRLPDNLKPMLAKLQMPVMKMALADPRFFTDPQHPARRTINDLFEMLLQFGAAEAAPSPQMVNELQGLVDAVGQAFNLDPARLRAESRDPVDDRTAESFLREQEEQQQKKNRARIERVRRIVSYELKRRIGDRRIAPGVMRLMLSGFGPLLCLDYIRNGIEGASWTQTMRLVDRVLASLEPTHATAEARAAEEAEIVATISRRLANIGFSEERLEEIISGLLQAYLELAKHPPRPAAPAADVTSPSSAEPPKLPLEQELQGLLSILLVPGAWFTLWDPAAQTKHWVRVRGYYPAQDNVMFGHYMEERYLRMRATAFATALVEGHASAIDPSPELQSAIARLAELPFERTTDSIVWTTAEGRPV